MNAVVEIGNKQYIVEEGTIIDVDKVTDESSKSLKFDTVLLYNNGKETVVGQPYIKGATVTAKVLNQKIRYGN